MTEAQALSAITSVCDAHLDHYKIRRGRWEMINPTQYEADYFISTKEGGFSQELLSAMANQFTNNGGDIRIIGGGLDENDLDFDFMTVQAVINIHQV